MAEFTISGYDEIQTSSLVPEGDFDVIITSATGKPDPNGKMRIYYQARITRAYDQKNDGVIGFTLYGQPQIRVQGDGAWLGNELKKIIEAAHIPHRKDTNGNVSFDTDNWINREMTVSVTHSKSKDGKKTYANISSFREKAETLSAPAYGQPQMPQQAPQMPSQYAQPAPTVPQYPAQPQNANVSPQMPPQPMWGMGSKRS